MTQPTIATQTEQILTRQTAAQIYQGAAAVRHLWKGDDEATIHLFRGDVEQTDSPGSGRSDDGIEPFVQLTGELVLRKVLRVEGQPADAQLAFIGIEAADNETSLLISVNGHEMVRPVSRQATPTAAQYWQLAWSRWYYVAIPAAWLREGDNDIRVQSENGKPGWQVMVADYREFEEHDEHPDCSQRSEDGGATWSAERGEYVLRLAVDRYRTRGELVSEWIDVAAVENEAIKSRLGACSIALSWQSNEDGGSLRVWARTSSTPFDGGDASPWQRCSSGQPLPQTQGRYLQYRVEFVGDSTSTPHLASMQIDAQVEVEERSTVRVLSAQNPASQRSSLDMPHENPRCDMLVELRQRFDLDALIAGAQTEFEAIQRLHRWAYHIPLGACRHRPWNVLEWIDEERLPDGRVRMNSYDKRRRDKMCLYPNVVLVAALQSVGIVARHLNFHSEGMTGHEVAEVWSNDYGKWIHLDATRDYYWYDRRTTLPLDTEEVRRVLVERLDKVERWDDPYLFRQDLDELVQDLPIAFWDGDYEHSNADGDHGALFLLRSFCHFRIIPRYDVFSRPSPLPVSQGTEVWSWAGYLNWADDKVPPLPHFPLHSNRRADFYPDLGATTYTVTATEEERRLAVLLHGNMPDFECFEVRLDRGAWNPTDARFDWMLQDGANVLEVRARNRSGWPGRVSSLAVSP